MWSRFLKTAGYVLGGIAVVFTITYLLLVMFFAERFNTHTFINGIDATGLKSSEVSSLLAEKDYYDYSLLITDYYGNPYVIDGADTDFGIFAHNC